MDQKSRLELIVAGEEGPSLLGRNWLSSLRLDWNSILNLQDSRLDGLLSTYSSVFTEKLGTLKGFKAKIYVSDHKPIFCKARPVPYAIRPQVEVELDRLTRMKIIEPIPFSDWAAPIVPVMKPDRSIRICGDFKCTVNRVSKIDRYPIPKIDDLFSKLSGGVVFSKLDLSQAYQQLELDEESKQYTVINTHKGLFRYHRLPFGVSSAPGIFQRVMESLLSDIPGTIVYLDDILVSGSSKEDHLQKLQKVLEKLQSAGLSLKKEKCMFLVNSVSYLGHRIDAKGLHPLPGKLEAIVKAPAPKSITELKAFIGLMNYYSKFVPNLASLLHPLYQLLGKSVPWSWTPERQAAFDGAKKLLTAANVLIHFDPQKDLVLACDASNYGLGAVLSHRFPDGSERPIAFASRTLSAAECRYSQIEKETLACVFGIKKFHVYLYGRTFKLVTDHKPLLFLLSEQKAVPTTVSNRIQRWALLLSMYEYTISYRCSKDHANADALSRLPLSSYHSDPPIPAETVLLLEQMSDSPITVDQIRSWTQRDPIMSQIVYFTLYGWPAQLDSTYTDFIPYWNRKLELSTQDGVLLWRNRVVIPPQGRQYILDELHISHPGVTRMKSLSRMFVWWPNMDSNIEVLVKTCSVCQSQRPTPPSAPIQPWRWLSKPWSRLHLDFAGPFMGHTFLIIIDAYSKWLEVRVMTSTTSTAIISALRGVFAQFGLPSIIVTDNAQNFSSAEFELFLTNNGIKHIFSPPYHPSSNGLAERAVQSFKQALRKTTGGSMRDRVSHVLFYSHITPSTTTGMSPSELLQNRRLRTRLDLLRPNISGRVFEKQEKQQQYADLHSKARHFEVGEAVYARDYSGKNKWIPGHVSSSVGNVSYDVALFDGRVIRRHVDQMRQRLEDGDITMPLVQTEIPLSEDVASPTPHNAQSTEPSLNTQKNTPEESQEVEDETSPSMSPTTTRYPQRHRKPPDRYVPSF